MLTAYFSNDMIDYGKANNKVEVPLLTFMHKAVRVKY